MERRIIDSFDTAIEAKLTPFTQMQLAIIDLVRETIAQNIGSAMTSAMGIDVIDLSAKLSTIPNEMQQAFQRIRDQREHTRSISQELSDAEIVCKLANGVEGKNAEERALNMQKLLSDNPTVKALRSAKNEADENLRQAEYELEVLTERSKNMRAVARMLAAVLNGDNGNGD